VAPAVETWLRRLLFPLALALLVFVASRHSRTAAFGVAVVAVALLAVVFVVLPRLAHAAFERGVYTRAQAYYRLVRVFVASPTARGALDVSLAGCRLAAGDFEGALGQLARVRPQTLPVAARAAWHNNRAYALARGPGDPTALEEIDEAVRLRPDIAGFRHTRGVVLLAMGRLDEAIGELDEVWRQGATAETSPILEAERCYDLGVAWSKKGERDYARDYFIRAQAVAPGSEWARRAQAEAAG
jgi:hypothetical protein